MGLLFFKGLFWWAYIRGLGAATSYPVFLVFLILGYGTSPLFDIRKARNPAGDVVIIGLHIFIFIYIYIYTYIYIYIYIYIKINTYTKIQIQIQIYIRKYKYRLLLLLLPLDVGLVF